MLYLKKGDERVRQTQAARELLLLGLSLEYGIRVLPKIKRSEQGKPYFPDYPAICFNYSHSPRGILCGIARTQIGVDMERRIDGREKLAARICHERELRLLADREDAGERARLLTRFWTAKESYLKCIGLGIRTELSGLDFSDCAEGGLFRGVYRMSFLDGEDYGIAVCMNCGDLPGAGPSLHFSELSPEEAGRKGVFFSQL